MSHARQPHLLDLARTIVPRSHLPMAQCTFVLPDNPPDIRSPSHRSSPNSNFQPLKTVSSIRGSAQLVSFSFPRERNIRR
jgi:hypothetical protein